MAAKHGSLRPEMAEAKRPEKAEALPPGSLFIQPPPEPPFDIHTMEPIEVPPQAIWRNDFEEFGADRWTEGEPAWTAPELDLGDGLRLALGSPDPFPEGGGSSPRCG